VKPWLGAIKEPTYEYPKQATKEPDITITLEYVHGYRVKDCRQNLYYSDTSTIIFHAAAVLIYHSIPGNSQVILSPHTDDILSIDYHKPTNQVITGEIGPKPLVCLFKNQKLLKTFAAPVKKGVLAVAISPDGKKAACAGMDDDHCVAVLELDTGKLLTMVKGTKKVITKIVWISNSQFVSIGISHYKLWTLDKNNLTGK
jgi:microtubule-associated protein-like 6